MTCTNKCYSRAPTCRTRYGSMDWLKVALLLVSSNVTVGGAGAGAGAGAGVVATHRNTTNDNVTTPIFHAMELHPTALLEQRRRRKLRGGNVSSEEHWFHPNSNAVYATLPKEDDSCDDDGHELVDFHRFRHMSRWELQYRRDNGVDLELDWNRTYYSRDLQQEEQVLHGGRYNNYAAAPLSQGYGTHYANVWVGSPKAQRKSVIVDTGSHYTAFPCKGCENCGEEHHTDPYFDPSLSDTFRALECKQCQLGATCRDQRCYFSQSYTEGSSWEAYQVEDLVYLGGRDMLAMADPRNADYAIPFMFGCQTSENGLFVTQLADGIMGMSAHEYTLTKQMFEKGKVEHNLFALCFRRELGTSKKGVTAGVMTLGGIDNRVDLSPMLFAKNVASTGWFTVYVKNIFIRAGGGQRATSIPEPGQHVLKIPLDLVAVNSGKGVIVDSGTTDTYLHKKLAKSFASVWKTVTKKEYSHSGFLLSDDQLRRLPTILVQMRAHSSRVDPSLGSPTETIGFAGGLDPAFPYDVLLAIPATNYMEYSPTTGLYTSRLYFTETQGGVLGANAMQGHNVVFDWENGRVGFAESSCDYEDEHSAMKIEGASGRKRFGNDCVLGKGVLTHSCVKSVDVTACGDDSGQTLFGTEVWTRPVETFGSDSGMSCHDVVLLDTPHNGESPPHITCEAGLCEEYRPCHLSCKDVDIANTVLAESNGPACDFTWSACDESCTQSVVQVTQKTDGVCHESSRSSRDCHTGACGKDDPCRVPYLVHATLGFRKANRSLWNAASSEILAQSVAQSLQRVGQVSDISVGDVNVMMASPWHEDPESAESGDLGLKVVLQISFYNINAKLVTADGGPAGGSQVEGDGQRRLSRTGKAATDLFQRKKQKSTCLESDLYPLASNALAVHNALKKDEFMRTLIGEMKRLEGGDQNFEKSPFGILYNENEMIAHSRVISAWTVRTEIEDSGGVRKGLLQRSPIKSYSVSGRTIWLTISGIGLLLLYAADRHMNPEKEEKNRRDAFEDKNHDESTTVRRSSRSRYASRSGVDDSDEALFKQLFRPNGKNESYFDDDDLSQASSTLLGENISWRRGDSGDVELAARKSSKVSTNKKSRRSRRY